ncbi:MAG: hypothetical protein ACOYOS_20410 [Syntrophales bacterium]
MKKEYDFSKGDRGKFYRPDIQLNLPVYLEPDIREKVIQELRMIPDEQMGNIYEFLHHIRTEPQNLSTNSNKIMGLATTEAIKIF